MMDIERFCRGIERIDRVQWELTTLASAFVRTGNHPISEELFSMAADLDKAKADMQTAWSTELDRAFLNAQQHSATVLKAALAGVTIASHSNAEQP